MANPDYSLTGIKRAHDHENHESKRPRCGDCASDSQPAFYLRGQRKGPFLKTSKLFYSRKNDEDSEIERAAPGLSGSHSIQIEPSASTGDGETFLLNVSPVDYLALLEMSGYSKYH
jgi:hypothetical protein